MKSTYNEILQNMKAVYNKEIGREIAENSIDEKKLEAIASELYGLSCYGDFILKQALFKLQREDILTVTVRCVIAKESSVLKQRVRLHLALMRQLQAI